MGVDQLLLVTSAHAVHSISCHDLDMYWIYGMCDGASQMIVVTCPVVGMWPGSAQRAAVKQRYICHDV